MKTPTEFEDFRLHRSVLEVRYPKAHRYWDDCGKLIATLEQRLPGLTCARLSENGFQFEGTAETGVSRAVFFWDRAIAEHDSTISSSKFIDKAAVFWLVVAQGLDVEATTRVGNRYWLRLPAGPGDQAKEWMASRSIWRLDDRLRSWGTPQQDSATLMTELRSENAGLRVQVGAGTIKDGDSEYAGVIVDADFHLLKAPSRAVFDPEAFMKKNHQFLKRNLLQLFTD